MALSLTLAAAVALVAGTALRASWRGAEALRRAPPEGQVVEIDGLRVHAVVRGTGPDLILLHGASGGSRDMTFALVDALAGEFRVIAFDRPGLGHSDPLPDASVPVDPTTGAKRYLSAQAAHLRKAAAALGVSRPLLAGQSYGGSVALAWALDDPDLAGLVLISAPSLPWPGPLDPWYRATSGAVGRALLVPLAAAWVPQSYVRQQTAAVFAPDAMPEGYVDHLDPLMLLRSGQLRANVTQVNALRAEIVTMEPRYAALSLPIEMVHGLEDRIVPFDIHSGPLAPRLPTARLTAIPGAGHMAHHTHLSSVLRAVRAAAERAELR